MSEEPGETKLPGSALRATQTSRPTCPELKVRIKGRWLTALVDSGVDHNCIAPDTVNELQLPWRHKQHPYPVFNLEGERFSYDTGQVTIEIDHLKVFVNGGNQGIDFDILPSPGYELVLGLPWL